MCDTDGGSAAVVLPRWNTRTSCSFSTSARTIHCPINPVPPIINTRIALRVLYVRPSSFAIRNSAAPIRFLWNIQQAPDKTKLLPPMPFSEELARQRFVAILNRHGSR
jgi:hypothetical protein